VARLATDHVTLRPGYTRYSPVLRDTEWAPSVSAPAAGTPQLRGKFPVYRTYPGHSGKVSMTEKNSGPQEGVKGVVEDVKGKAN